ncbi:nucleotidyltransferase family protein [Schleiferiaceae bacterium]|nr:nucleotidyltransferase family protein [Schleiferiaceae bacterium]
MRDYKQHLIRKEASLKVALGRLDKLGADTILFVVDEGSRLLGSLTDGDVRRGLLKGKSLEESVANYIQREPKSVNKENYSITEIIKLREQNFKVLPVLDADKRIINVINFRYEKSYLPLDALVMAGGRGSRLSPMTDTIPKPLLKVGNKAIIDHNIDRLRSYGIDDFHISVRYLGGQLEDHYNQRALSGINLNFVWEKEALGTLGAASLIENFQHDCVLITNSDILTTLDYEDFFLDFLEKEADMSVATIPYQVDIPYAVMETKDHRVINFKEKPTYTYYSNGGIYIVRRELLNRIPKNSFYNATDLMEQLIKDGGKLISYPIRQYWLDIGKPQDFEKAQLDIKHLDL